jgi:hypothetical protein
MAKRTTIGNPYEHIIEPGARPAVRARPAVHRIVAPAQTTAEDLRKRAALEVAALWPSLPPDRRLENFPPAEELAPVFLTHHARELDALCAALRTPRGLLPWRVLRPIAKLRWWWPVDPEGPEDIRNLPAQCKLVTMIYEHLNPLVGVNFAGVDVGLADKPWWRETIDHLGRLRKNLEFAQSHLSGLLAGTRGGRLEGHEKNPEHKHDGKAQNLARLRSVAVGLAMSVNRALPRRRTDSRVRHGVLRAGVIRHTVGIVQALYGVTFTPAELRDLLHKHLKTW